MFCFIILLNKKMITSNKLNRGFLRVPNLVPWLISNVNILGVTALPCEQWFLQAGRYRRETPLSRIVRPGETTARRVLQLTSSLINSAGSDCKSSQQARWVGGGGDYLREAINQEMAVIRGMVAWVAGTIKGRVRKVQKGKGGGGEFLP